MGAPAARAIQPVQVQPKSKGSVLLGSECCVATGDSGCDTAVAWGVGLSHERSYIAGAESFYSLEGNMCGTATRGADALPGSKATSRAKGSHRKLGGLVSGRQRRVSGTVPIVGVDSADGVVVLAAPDAIQELSRRSSRLTLRPPDDPFSGCDIGTDR
jgi:hypothetical protein